MEAPVPWIKKTIISQTGGDFQSWLSENKQDLEGVTLVLSSEKKRSLVKWSKWNPNALFDFIARFLSLAMIKFVMIIGWIMINYWIENPCLISDLSGALGPGGKGCVLKLMCSNLTNESEEIIRLHIYHLKKSGKYRLR